MTDNRRDMIDCELCGSSSFLNEFEKDGYSGARCAKCGLVFINPQPDSDYLRDEVYGEEYFNAEKGYGLEDALGAGGREARARADRLLSRIEKKIAPGKLLDVGCAAGFTSAAARDRGWDVLGIEISDFAAAHARNQLKLNVKTGSLTDMELPANHFDLALMLDVIEHFKSPGKAFDKAFAALRPGGLALVMTPNYDGIASKKLGAAWGLVAPEHHLFYFTPETLTKMAEKSGFKLASIEFPMWGLSELLLSAGSLQKAGIPVKDSSKKFVRKYLKAPRDMARAAVSVVDKALLTPIYRKKTGGTISAIFQKPE